MQKESMIQEKTGDREMTVYVLYDCTNFEADVRGVTDDLVIAKKWCADDPTGITYGKKYWVFKLNHIHTDVSKSLSKMVEG